MLRAQTGLIRSLYEMLHCSVIRSLMIAIFICEQSGTYRMVDVAMLSFCSTDSSSARTCALLAERRV
ncbi:hypothetical protein XavaCFBP5823_05330 [Xanthomonas axonopodis pv. vasculorum]|nr:hypothetical protein XavaCFBP5823_05330 [Xanthomonas axonopodis pv. vasculorum]